MLYINQRFVPLVLLAGVGMLFLAQVMLRERPSSTSVQELQAGETHSGHDHEQGEDRRSGWMLWLVALPLLIGVLVPVRPLSSSALSSRGVNFSAGPGARTSAGSGSENGVVLLPPEQRSVLDWLRRFGEGSHPSSPDGEAADITGFVYHDPRLETTQFMVSRFAIACCVADAMALGMVVDWPGAEGLPDNQWVRVRGTVYGLQMDGKTIPAIHASQVEAVPAPEQPYLFP